MGLNIPNVSESHRLFEEGEYILYLLYSQSEGSTAAVFLKGIHSDGKQSEKKISSSHLYIKNLL